MKSDIQIKRFFLITSLIVLYTLVMLTGLITYRYYRVIAEGILGLATMYLLFFFGRHSKTDMSIDALLLNSNKRRIFMITFVSGVVFFWATMQFLEMVLFFLKR